MRIREWVFLPVFTILEGREREMETWDGDIEQNWDDQWVKEREQFRSLLIPLWFLWGIQLFSSTTNRRSWIEKFLSSGLSSLFVPCSSTQRCCCCRSQLPSSFKEWVEMKNFRASQQLHAIWTIERENDSDEKFLRSSVVMLGYGCWDAERTGIIVGTTMSDGSLLRSVGADGRVSVLFLLCMHENAKNDGWKNCVKNFNFNNSGRLETFLILFFLLLLLLAMMPMLPWAGILCSVVCDSCHIA